MIANLKSFALCKQMLFSGAAFQGAAAGWNTRWLPARDRVRAAIDGGRITIFLPQAAADEWVATDRSGPRAANYSATVSVHIILFVDEGKIILRVPSDMGIYFRIGSGRHNSFEGPATA